VGLLWGLSALAGQVAERFRPAGVCERGGFVGQSIGKA